MKRRPSPAMVVAVLALVVAMGGTGYAALKLPKNSVGASQIKKNAVTSPKVKDGSLLSKDFKAGQLPAGPVGQTGPKGDQGAPGKDGTNGVNGKDGTNGTNGSNGTNGTNGITGPTGPSDAFSAVNTNPTSGPEEVGVDVPAGDYVAVGEGNMTNGAEGTPPPDGAARCDLASGRDPSGLATGQATVPGTGLAIQSTRGGAATIALHSTFHLDVDGTITMTCSTSPNSAPGSFLLFQGVSVQAIQVGALHR